MPILNYTTKVSAAKTVLEFQQILVNGGVRQIQVEYYDKGQPGSLRFSIPYGSHQLHFELPARWRGVQAALRKQRVKPAWQTEAHARRVAWRIVKDWVEAQVAVIQSGQAELAEVFLPYMLAEGRTVYQEFKERNLLLPG